MSPFKSLYSFLFLILSSGLRGGSVEGLHVPGTPAVPPPAYLWCALTLRGVGILYAAQVAPDSSSEAHTHTHTHTHNKSLHRNGHVSEERFSLTSHTDEPPSHEGLDIRSHCAQLALQDLCFWGGGFLLGGFSLYCCWICSRSFI